MAFQPCPNCAEFVFKQTLFTQPIANVIHISRDSGWSATPLTTMATSLEAAWAAQVAPLLSEHLVLRSIAYRDLGDELGSAGEYTFNAVPGGLTTPQPLPYSTAMVITLRTAYVGRSYRGRIYQAGLTTAQISDAEFLASSVEEMVTAWENMQLACSSQVGARMVVLSRYHNKTLRASGVSTPVTSIQANNLADRMSRRNPKTPVWH